MELSLNVIIKFIFPIACDTSTQINLNNVQKKTQSTYIYRFFFTLLRYLLQLHFHFWALRLGRSLQYTFWIQLEKFNWSFTSVTFFRWHRTRNTYINWKFALSLSIPSSIQLYYAAIIRESKKSLKLTNLFAVLIRKMRDREGGNQEKKRKKNILFLWYCTLFLHSLL